MSYFTLYLLFLCGAIMYFLHCFHFSMAIRMSNETDMLALLEIKAQIKDDPLGVLDSWNHTNHMCQWFGVTCGHRHQRVTELQLSSSKLTGLLSPFIGNLSFLREVYLDDNNFGGILPSEIGRLNRLQRLILRDNAFEGHISSNISACTKLVALDVTRNRLVGGIPFEFSSLSYLQVLALSDNNLGGTIPSWLGNLSSLSHLYLVENNLTGSIPESISRLKTLIVISLGMNVLSGVVPHSIFNLTTLEVINLGKNFLEGNLPSYMGNTLPNLQRLTIFLNNISGFLPNSISNLTNLQIVGLANNNLKGHVPSLHKLVNLVMLDLSYNPLGYGLPSDLSFVSSLANATNLQRFIINGNNFRGMFPRILCNFSRLITVGVSYNYIVGDIPSCISSLEYLEEFDAPNNQLSGVIPQDIGKLQRLIRLELWNNQLSGHVPSNIGNLTKLTNLELDGNKLQGQIPPALGNCRSILSLLLSDNQLSGMIPTQMFTLYTLPIYQLNISNNNLIGSLPLEVGQLTNLVTLDVSANKLSGEIPSTLSACAELEELNMMRNSFEGTIPDTLKALKSLQVLDLSLNNLSGKIPEFLASLPLQALNLSYNDLEGEVPKGGIFGNASAISIVGNAKLCGGIAQQNLPKCTKQPKRTLKHNKRLKLLVVLLGLLGVVLMLTLFVSIYFFWYKKSLKKPTTSDNNSEKFPTLSYQALHKATNGFSSENLIGSGTFGMVYRGILDNHDPSVIAVKMFKLEQHGASKVFMAECGILQNIRHRNLVKILTVCSSVDYKGNDFKALIYEYMVNGSLQDWLYPNEVDMVQDHQSIDVTPRRLNLRQRLDVIVDVAIALEYLHHHCGTSIVHCDLKPSNILLDEELVAHVGDFGLAKFLSKNINNISHANQPSSSLGVRGTVGYTPPEYGMGNEVSTNGDVYSFGFVLLEIFTGKKPTNDMFNEGISLHHFVKEALPERVVEILDQSLLNDLDGDEINRASALEGLVTIFEIAITCSAELPQERLDMRDVSRKLSSVRDKLLRTHFPRRRRIHQ